MTATRSEPQAEPVEHAWDDYAAKVVQAITAIDRSDPSMFYVGSFTISESGEDVAIATWNGRDYEVVATP